MSIKSKEEAVTVARSVIERMEQMKEIAKKLADDDMLGLECAESVQLEGLVMENGVAALAVVEWVLKEHG